MIQVSSASIGDRERELVLGCLASGRLTQGAMVREFEAAFAARCGAAHAVACSTGTAALHLAMLAIGVERGSRVVVPALTYVATANAALYCGADVEFCDVDPVSWCIDPVSCSVVVRGGSAFVVPVHLYDAEAPLFNLPSAGHRMILDAAHAVGAYNHQDSPARLTTFSFFGSKVITTGEGGAVVTDSDHLAERMRLLRGQGATTPGRYHHSVVGFNYRMTELQAALGLAQLERLDEFLFVRAAIVSRYRRNLAGSPVTLQGGKRAAGWMVAVLLPPGADRDQVAARMLAAGVETRPFFELLPTLPPYGSHDGGQWPVAQDVARRGLCLPTHVAMTPNDVDLVCDRLLETASEVAA
jgi:perosamine synthetase